MSRNHVYPIPAGFEWSHAANAYLNAEGKIWDDKTNEIRDPRKPQTVASTSDERVTNNVMRHEYRVLSEDEKAKMQALKDKGVELYQLIDSLGSSRETSLAKTKCEEAVMWAVKHLTK